MIKIGIDPAFRTGGFCICIIEDADVYFKTFKHGFLDFLSWLIHDRPQCAVQVIIENSNLQNVTFDMTGTKAMIAKKSRNVGTNQAASQYTVDVCSVYFGAANVHGISPKEKGAKVTNERIFAAIVKTNGHRLTSAKTTQDERDAYMLACYRLPLNRKTK